MIGADEKKFPLPKKDGEASRNQMFYVSTEYPKIRHIIMAKEGSEAGNYYNSSAKQIIEASILHEAVNARLFKVEEELKIYLMANFNKYIESGKDYKTDLCMETMNPDDQGKYLTGCLKMSSETDVPFEFKASVVDESGMMKLYQTKALQLQSEVFETDDMLVLQVDAAGMENIDTLKITPIMQSDSFYFMITGKKGTKEETSNKIYHQKEINYGDITFSTNQIKPLSLYAKLDLSKKEKTYVNGVLTLKLPKRKESETDFL